MKSKEEEQKEFEEVAKKFSDAAYPVTMELQYKSNPSVKYESTSKGMSKRELYALEILNGLLAGKRAFRRDTSAPGHIAKYKHITEDAVELADMLIKELNK